MALKASMRVYARFVTRNAVLIIALIALVSVGAAYPLPVGYDDDVVRFLPQADPEVARFNRISEQFGSLNVALVGVESDDLYTPERLEFVRALHEVIEACPEVKHVTGITELAVITGVEEAEHKELVPKPVPTDAAALAAIKAEILGLDYISGVLVSSDGTGAMLVAQLAGGEGTMSTKVAAEAVRAAAATLEVPEGVRLHFAGAPFIAEAAANGSQADLRRLAPYVVCVIVLLILITLGSFRAAILTLGTVGLGILWTLGFMAWIGESLTLVSTSLPVILVALGSAYAVHLLVWYFEHGADVEDMLVNMGWPVIVTGLTTVAGFVSFMVMDLAPMREFGWQMALGTGVCTVLSLLMVPAFLHLLPLPPRKPSRAGERFDTMMVRLAVGSRTYRRAVIATMIPVAIFFAMQLPNIETRMDASSFFESDSDPALAEAFMEKQFGGSVYLQVLVTGDIRDPAVLARIAAFEDRLASVEGVTQVQSISNVLAIVHEGLKGQRRLSRKREEIAQLGFLARRTDPAVSLLVDEDWSGALLQVGIGRFDTGMVEPMTTGIRALADKHLQPYARTVPRGGDEAAVVLDDAAERIAGLAGKGPEVVAAVRVALADAKGLDEAALFEGVKKVIDLEIGEDEMVELEAEVVLDDLSRAIATEAAARKLTAERFVALLGTRTAAFELKDMEAFGRAARYVHNKVMNELRPLMTGDAAESVLALTGELPPRMNLRVRAIVDDVMQPTWVVGSTTPADTGGATATPVPIEAIVSGYPVLQQAMTRSVQRNQEFSLLVSVPLVLLIMCLVFGSVIAGIIGIIPSALTLLVTFGLMGLFPRQLPLDIGASMLSSIALGVGIDYAIHFMWRYREGGLHAAVRTTGRSISINAAEITAGFIILAWATIVPMARFGLLTAETLLVAAAATLVLLPALLDWWKPAEGPGVASHAHPSTELPPGET